MPRAPRLEPRHPWPLPTALGLATGIACSHAQLPPWLLLLAPLSSWLLAGLLLSPVAAGRATRPSVSAAAVGRAALDTPLADFGSVVTGRPSAPESRSAALHAGFPSWRAVLALLLPLLAVYTGYLRYDWWQSRPDPLEGWWEREGLFSGVSHGAVILLEEPSGARVVASPRAAVPPGRVQVKGTLQRPPGRRNPGAFDYAGYLRRRGIHGILRVEQVLGEGAPTPVIERLRVGVAKGLGADEAALMAGMTLGLRDELGELQGVFAAAGLAHLLALSGLHVGVLLAAAGWLLAPLGTGRYPLLLLLLAAYVLIVGGSPSVVRASLMAAVVLIALWQGAGRVEPWSALGLAALLTLLARPAWLFDLSFQLSYLAVLGILLFAMPLARLLLGQRSPPWWHPRITLGGGLVTSCAAQALTLPLVASSFGSLPLLSPLVNVLALPLASILVPLGFTAGLLGLVSPAVAGLVNLLTGQLARALLELAAFGAALPATVWGEVEPLGYLCFAAAMGAAALASRGLLRPHRALLLVALASLLSAVTPPSASVPEFVALDVGQGDSFLIRLPGRVEVLIDGGGSPFSDFDTGSAVVLPALRALGVDELELVIASHADTDHVEGLASVIRKIPVQLLLTAPGQPLTPAYREVLSAAGQRGVEVQELTRGQLLHLGAATIEVLNPPPRSNGSSNDDSLVVVLYLHGLPKVLLPGDISSVVESGLSPPRVDLMVAPHHGSNGSSSARFLTAVRPRDVVISVGRNRYGHPSDAVLARLAAVGARVHQTRELGAVRLPLSR